MFLARDEAGFIIGATLWRVSRSAIRRAASFLVVAGLVAAPTRRQIVTTLQSLGLIDLTGTPRRRVIELTSRGRAHPQYDLRAAKAPPLNQAVDLDHPMIETLLALHTLGEARSLALTFATGIGRGQAGGKTGTGQYIQRLQHIGFVERTARDKTGHRPYRVTKNGLAFTTLRGQILRGTPLLAIHHTVLRRS